MSAALLFLGCLLVSFIGLFAPLALTHSENDDRLGLGAVILTVEAVLLAVALFVAVRQ